MKADLKIYRARRDLKKNTKKAEPYGSVKKSDKKQPLYVVQLHDASHLHYDLRLEIDGVLKSWAVPKGLPEKVGIRRLAIPTDDHPYDYGHFEGIIPEGYGAGTVMVWDIGTFENIKEKKGKPVSLHNSYEMGTVEVIIYGKKVQGPYALIRTDTLANKESWILVKMKSRGRLINKNKKKIRKNVSALTGRTMKKIEQDDDAEWT